VTCLELDVALLMLNFIKIWHCLAELWKCIYVYMYTRCYCCVLHVSIWTLCTVDNCLWYCFSSDASSFSNDDSDMRSLSVMYCWCQFFSF